MRLVEGDAASVSAFAACLHRRADRFATCGERLLRAVSELDGWTGPDADAARNSLTAQAQAAASAATAVHCVVAVLQRHAVDLARATAMARHAQTWCAGMGLVVGEDAQVRPAPGVLLLDDGPGGVTAQAQRFVDAAREHAREAAQRCASDLAPVSRGLTGLGAGADGRDGRPAAPGGAPGGRCARY